MGQDRRAYLRAYLNNWRRKRKEKDIEEGIVAPMSESQSRRRRCRECGEKVEATSYWYCHAHNRLSGEDDDLVYSVSTNVETY
jgi:hypothetical protein